MYYIFALDSEREREKSVDDYSDHDAKLTKRQWPKRAYIHTPQSAHCVNTLPTTYYYLSIIPIPPYLLLLLIPP